MNIKIRGGQVLSGEVVSSGSKNSAVSIIAATILLDGQAKLQNVPDISDTVYLIKILENLGSQVDWDKTTGNLTINNSNLTVEKLGFNEFSGMRGAVLLWGPLLARFQRISFKDLPKGCSLGRRPLDTHYSALRDLGVTIIEQEGEITLDATAAQGNTIWLAERSPTATENVVMLSTGLPGKTTIIGAAYDPQVQDTVSFLISAGAKIIGNGTDHLEIEGKKTLTSTTHRLLSDHYEIATFLALGAITGGEVKVKNSIPELFPMITREFSKLGVSIIHEDNYALVRPNGPISLTRGPSGQTTTIRAEPWPALPVDILPLLIPIALAAPSGSVLFHNWMYESGLFWTEELKKLGAAVILADPHRVLVNSGNKMHGATLEAPYIIRAVVALVMASLMATGETTILNADALYRGHPHFAEKLASLGAQIEQIG
jgi:UDP-N-acetylglucosamine 1-carboxyvinyltransferase